MINLTAQSKSRAPILITGGARRLGLATALALHSDEHPVIITYRRERAGLAALKRRGIETLQADFSDEQAIARLADKLCSRFDSLRAIIHNAAQWLPENDAQADVEVMQQMLKIHVMAPFLLNQECGELLRRYGQHNACADIIHMTDFVADSGSQNHIAYAASKAALQNMTLSYARKLAPQVKVNSIAPALLMFNQNDDAVYRERSSKKSLLQIAPGEAEGVNAVQYILQSRYLTGKTIALDGGRHIARAS